jgi:hypothetical protein
MGYASTDEALSKGPVVRALDEMSTSDHARERLTALRDAIKNAAVYQGDDPRFPDFPTLSDVIRNKLFAYWSKMQDASGNPDGGKLDNMTDYLKTYWFGDKPREYPAFPTRAIYGMGLIKALDSSLRGKPNPLPIDGYWFIHADRVELVSLESSRQVTLLISTPPPVSDLYRASNRQAACDAWVTTATDKAVHLEVSPPDLDPAKPITPVSPRRTGYRICTYKIEGGP